MISNITLRWFALAPCALGAYIGTWMILAVVNVLLFPAHSDGFTYYVPGLILAPMALVWCGSKVAPQNKTRIATQLVMGHAGIITICALMLITGRIAARGDLAKWKIYGGLALTALAPIPILAAGPKSDKKSR